MKLNWKALLRDRCPKCGGPLVTSPNTLLHFCTGDHCEFRIANLKFQSIRYKMEHSERGGKRNFEEGYGD
jgi:hypothetical protein